MKKALTEDEYNLVAELGRPYEPAVLPDNIPRGEVGTCFDTCALLALNYPGYQYVEGIALSPDNRKKWILHAWLTDGAHAFDPTWKATDDNTGKEVPIPTEYVGIEMDIIKVAAFMRLTGYQGIIANRFRSPQIVDDILGVTA